MPPLIERREQDTSKSGKELLKLTYFKVYFSIDIILHSLIYDKSKRFKLVGWLVVFYVPSKARSFRDGTPIYCPLRRT